MPWIRLGIVAVIIFVVTFTAQAWINPMYTRYQAVQNAHNQVLLNEIIISQEQQNIQVVHMQAEQKIEEAKGIAAAQRIINGTLTPQYLQHEAIGAQLEAAKNSSHTETIYIPSGTQGIPITPVINTH
jgi:hypothetical protein